MAKNVDFTLTPKQFELFYKILPKYKFVVATKGRRFGFTFSAIRFAFLQCIQNQNYSILWGDTTQQNISRYIDRYLMPFARNFKGWRMNKTEHRLEFDNGSYIDFRSADRPENWEGFGYDLVILNEAGIILKNRYLWENSVRPMMLDNPNSKALIVGAPKGKNLFYELFITAIQNPDRWYATKYTTYDNPLIDKDEIKRMEAELPESVVKQEIYGEFIDDTEMKLFMLDLIDDNIVEPDYPTNDTIYIGVDVALGGNDYTVLTFIKGNLVYRIDRLNIVDSYELARIIYGIARSEYTNGGSQVYINVEVDGLGIGMYNDLIQFNDDDFIFVNGIRMGSNPKNKNKYKYANRRAELYFNVRQLLEKGKLKFSQKLITNQLFIDLKKQMLDIEFGTSNSGKLIIEPKEEFKARNGGRSPDELDSLVLACAYIQ